MLKNPALVDKLHAVAGDRGMASRAILIEDSKASLASLLPT